MRGEGLQALDFRLVFTGNHPADTHPGRQGLGKARAVDHTPQAIKRLERFGLALLEHQLAIDIVFDNLDIEIRSQTQQLLLPIFRNSATERVAQPRGQHQRLDRPLVGRKLQRFQTDTGRRITGNLDDLQPQQIGQLQQTIISR
ncbi:hypothetical protein D3C81_1292460 [compost metagenome]